MSSSSSRLLSSLYFFCSFSGSDISVVVREALMEPLRKCRTAKFFKPLVVPASSLPSQQKGGAAGAGAMGAGGAGAGGAGAAPTPVYAPGQMFTQWTPVMEDPPCSRCPPNLSSNPVKPRTICPSCGCMRATLFDLSSDELRVPDMGAEDFANVLGRTKATVAARELARFEEFTKEFGSSGE